MQLGMIGLGRMGANMVRRLTKDGYTCVLYDLDAAMVHELEQIGVRRAPSVGCWKIQAGPIRYKFSGRVERPTGG